MTRSIEIIITPSGKMSVQTIGFVGTGCREASKFLEAALGQRTDERLTAEFYQTPSAQQQQRQQA